MKKTAIMLALTAMFAPSLSHAQVQIDMGRVTCAEYLAAAPEKQTVFAAWMSGWFNQKLGYTFIDIEACHRNIENVTKFCAAHPQETVMKVLQDATAKK
jgi:hypothetical protein